MSTDIAFSSSNWDFNKSAYKEVDLLPLMPAPGPVVIILVTYLLFTLKIGPSYMKNREPYKLTAVLIVYNAVQVVISAYLVKMSFGQLVRVGLAPKNCHITNDNNRSEIIYVIWAYFFAKVTELLDTVFFVMRKKYNQVTFLHLYHHSIMVASTWVYLKYWPSERGSFVVFLNSLVHVFMYTYYGLTALGPKVEKYVFWKQHITKCQIVQFVCMIIYYVIAAQRSECPSTPGIDAFVCYNALFFLILFLNFYWQRYTKRGKNLIPPVCRHIEKEA